MGGGLDIGGGHPGNPACLLHVQGGHIGRVGLKAVDVLLDVRLVMPAVADDDAGDAVGQKAVGTRLHPQVEIGVALDARGDPGIHAQHRSPPALEGVHPVGHVPAGVVGGAAPAHKELGRRHVGPGEFPGVGEPGHAAGREAGAGLGAVVDAAEHVGKALEHEAVPLGIAGVEGHGVGAVLLPDAQQLFSDEIVGLVPGDGRELPAPPGTHPLEGRADPVLPVDVVPVAGALGAQDAVVHGVPLGPLDLDYPAVLHIGIDAAVAQRGADVAHGALNGNPGVRAGNFGGDFTLQFRHAQNLQLRR